MRLEKVKRGVVWICADTEKTGVAESRNGRKKRGEAEKRNSTAKIGYGMTRNCIDRTCNGIDIDGKMSVKEFIKLTKNAYGGEIIKPLEKEYKKGFYRRIVWRNKS